MSLMLGAVVGALIVLPFALVYRARARDASAERRRVDAIATRARGILAAAPDGIFLWDHATGGISCSRRLAEMLEIESGTLARYDDIRACFEEDQLQKLEQGVSLLRAKGTPFDVTLKRADQYFQALGSRATGAGGEAVADIVWMRRVQAAAEGPANGRNMSGLEDRHLTALLDTLPIPLWLRDSDLKLAFKNRAAERIENLSDEIGRRARNDGRTASDAADITEDDTKRHVRITETPLAPAMGEKSGTIGFAVDMPETATSSETVTVTNSTGPSPRELLRPLESGVAVFDGETNLVAANAAFAALWRLDPDWLETRPSMSDLLMRLRELRRLPEVANFADFRNEELSRFETLKGVSGDELHLPDGRTMKRRFAPLDDGGLVISCDDVSDRLDMQRSLKSAGQVHSTTLENMREGIAVFGADGRLQLTNPQLATLWDLDDTAFEPGARLPDVIQSIGMKMAANDEKWSQRRERIASEILGRTLNSGRVDLINGRVLAFANVPLPDGASLVSYGDITDSFRVEEALRQRARTLAEADRMKTEFIANVAMEVRTPLNTIHGFADILRQEMFGELNKRQLEYTNGIVDTSEKMMGVVTDILDLATIEAGRMELNKDTVDPHAILVDAFNVVKEQAKKKNIKVDFDCPPDIGWIAADAKRLTQVVFNLLTNAITFTPKLGHVTLAAGRDGDMVEISVSDSGPGIPKDERDRVMQPFQRIKSDDHQGGGPGLGLTIVKRFVELHGGTIEIRSNKSRGATVVCRIPAGDGETEGVAPSEADRAIVDEHAAE